MTKINFVLFASIATLISCENHERKEVSSPKSFEYSISGDTINLIDGNGMKQGLWLMPISKDTVVYLNDTLHSVTTMTSGEMLRLVKREGNKNISALPDSFAVRSQDQ